MGISGRGLVVALPYLWLVLFFVVPFVIVLKDFLLRTSISRFPLQAADRLGRPERARDQDQLQQLRVSVSRIRCTSAPS